MSGLFAEGLELAGTDCDQIRCGTFTKRSLMPEGLEQSFTPEQWTELFVWLKSLR